jgi:hypothetical protein
VDLFYYGAWTQFLAAPFFNSPPVTPDQVDSIAIIGLAAGTTARQATAVFGPLLIDGRPEIIGGRDLWRICQTSMPLWKMTLGFGAYSPLM